MKLASRCIGFFVLLVVAFLGGYIWKDARAGELPRLDVIRAAIGDRPAIQKLTATQIFKQAFHRILVDYDKKVDTKELKYAGMEGLMASLGDPHTQFLEPRAATEFSKETKGLRDFVGVGARLSPDPLGARIRTVFKEGPAERAGVKNGDLITAVDGHVVAGKPVDDIVQLIRGKEGSTVRLTLIRGGESKPIVIAIKRGTIIAPSAEGSILEGTNIGYISVMSFSEPTSEQFDRALDDLHAKHIEGLIIDMRSNPGGLLETAREMLSKFVDTKPVVTMKGRNGKSDLVTTYPGLALNMTYPVVVLVNEESASAAEIFAGVLHDYKKATLVGEHTYGKASVQNVFTLVDGSSAKVTIARYYLPSGSDISRKVDDDGQYVSGGIAPDVKVPLDLDSRTIFGELSTDNQLQKAVELIHSKK